MPQGFLAVSTHPSSQLSLAGFHAWYEEEHIPIRLNKLEAFLSGARYYAIDTGPDPTKTGESQSQSEFGPTIRPTWLALYELSSTEVFSHSSYTSLRTQRSEREKDVMGRLEVLVRRTGGVVGVLGEPDGGHGERTTGLKVGRPSGYIVTHGVNVKVGAGRDEDTTIREWAEEALKQADDVSTGWVRTRLIKVLESGKTRMGVGVGLDADEAEAYFVVHEFVGEESAMSQDFKNIVVGTGGQEVLGRTVEVGVNDWRVWKLYRAYPSIAQGNVDLVQVQAGAA